MISKHLAKAGITRGIIRPARKTLEIKVCMLRKVKANLDTAHAPLPLVVCLASAAVFTLSRCISLLHH